MKPMDPRLSNPTCCSVGSVSAAVAIGGVEVALETELELPKHFGPSAYLPIRHLLESD